MASANYMMARRATTATNYRFLVTNDHHHQQTAVSELELDESDVWGGSTRSDSPESMPPPSSALRQSRRAPLTNNQRIGGAGGPKSMPVNIPDWSKILRDEYKLNRQKTGGLSGDEDDDYGDDTWQSSTERILPPHEYLARTRMASFSVHEGIGRTLKGRDLKRVRNAIWAKTGFQD